jgi:CheY-like chemotaxis protein
MIPEAVTTDSVEIPKIDWNSKKNEHKVTEVKEPVVVQAKTTDVVELETAKPEEQPLQQNPKELEISRLSCLYIEEQRDSQILVKVQMKELKEMKFAVSFEEALPLITSNQFDFIVMDINLQGEYNGLDALKMIRQMPVYAKLPIIAVTAYVLPGDKEKFVAAGFNDFISKPIFREKMIESLEKIFT